MTPNAKLTRVSTINQDKNDVSRSKVGDSKSFQPTKTARANAPAQIQIAGECAKAYCDLVGFIPIPYGTGIPVGSMLRLSCDPHPRDERACLPKSFITPQYKERLMVQY